MRNNAPVDDCAAEAFVVWEIREISYTTKKAIWIYQIAPFDLLCGRWDLNPHANSMHKILSLARLPVPTLPRIGLPPTVDIICMNPSFVNKKLYLFF